MITAFKEGTKELIFSAPGVKGICPYCENPLITKCGNITRHHFAHKSKTNCDSEKYYDGISDWHINWQFTIHNPIAGVNVEVPLNHGEYQKRADLVTPAGVIIEFQKSPLPLEERLLREKHYKKMIWVVHEDRCNSKTWDESVGDMTVLFDRSDRLYCRKEGFSIKKDKFIRSIINCQFFNERAWSVIKERGSRRNDKDIFEAYHHLIYDHGENIVGNAIDNNLLDQFRVTNERFWKDLQERRRAKNEYRAKY